MSYKDDVARFLASRDTHFDQEGHQVRLALLEEPEVDLGVENVGYTFDSYVAEGSVSQTLVCICGERCRSAFYVWGSSDFGELLRGICGG